MTTILEHVLEMVAALSVVHSSVDLSDVGRVQIGSWIVNPGSGPFVCLVPRGYKTDRTAQTLSSWDRVATVEIRAWAPSTADSSAARIAAGCAMAADIEKALEDLFYLDGSLLNAQSWDFRVESVDVVDAHELGGRAAGPWGMVGMDVVFSLESPERV